MAGKEGTDQMSVKKKSISIKSHEVAIHDMIPMPFRNISILTDFLKTIKRQEE